MRTNCIAGVHDNKIVLKFFIYFLIDKGKIYWLSLQLYFGQCGRRGTIDYLRLLW